ncbi:MAG: RHS repeat-associated core domain-containing protein, partial [Thermoanaerobaculia bacterium]
AVAFSKGRLTAITRAGQSVGYRYDRFGRVTQDGALVYAYDDNGNRTEIGYPGGVTVTYTHDYADRQETLTLEDGGNPSQPVVTSAAYKPSGPLTGLTLANGLTETRGYDQRYFPERIQVPGLLDWTFTTDAVGNILSITDAEDPAGARAYDYQDIQYFLTQGNGPWGELAWTYDKIGNRLTEVRDGETDVYQYLANTAGGRNPKLSEVNPGTEEAVRYFYDAAGNQTYRSEGATKQRFSYDSASRLSQTLTDSPKSARAMAQFRYDGRSFLDTATLTPFPGRPEQLTTTATYSSEGRLHHRATAEPRGAASPRNAPDRVTESYVLYFGGRPVTIFDKTEETDLEGQTSETTSLVYLSTDHLGTPVLATDAAGSETWSGGFEPFGSDFSGAQEAGIYLRFPGQWENEVWEGASAGESLYYNVHRWYEQQTGRYSRADPSGLRGGINELSYADANPVMRLDPTGLAYFARHRLSKFPWTPFASCAPYGLLDLLNWEVSHEHLFFEDGLVPQNIGFFGPDANNPNGSFKSDYRTDYKCRSRKYNDCVMRLAAQTAANERPRCYFLPGDNCQRFASDARRQYRELIKDPEIRKLCCVKSPLSDRFRKFILRLRGIEVAGP